jgi:hypothetical protein
MPSIVANILRAAGLKVDGSVPWGATVPSRTSGVYIVALSADADVNEGLIAQAPIDLVRVQRWLEAVPHLTLDDCCAVSAEHLAHRLKDFWFPDECVLYIGTIRQPLCKRVKAYYDTKLGKRGPHAGGHWIKALQQSVLDSSRIYLLGDEKLAAGRNGPS